MKKIGFLLLSLIFLSIMVIDILLLCEEQLLGTYILFFCLLLGFICSLSNFIICVLFGQKQYRFENDELVVLRKDEVFERIKNTLVRDVHIVRGLIVQKRLFIVFSYGKSKYRIKINENISDDVKRYLENIEYKEERNFLYSIMQFFIF